MQPKSQMKIYYEDRLVVRWINRPTGTSHFQGKRVSKDCKLTREEQRVYVQKGQIALVSFLIKTRSISFRDAMDIMKREQGCIRRRG